MLSFEARAASRWERNGRRKTRDQVSDATDQGAGSVDGLGASETGATRTGDTAGRRLVFGLRSGRSEPGNGLPRAMRARSSASANARINEAIDCARARSVSSSVTAGRPAMTSARLNAIKRRT